jgi:hypothetical protein
LWFFGVFFIEFNPSPDAYEKYKILRYVGLEVGEWYRQKRQAENAIMENIKLSDPSSFFLSEEAVKVRKNSLT